MRAQSAGKCIFEPCHRCDSEGILLIQSDKLAHVMEILLILQIKYLCNLIVDYSRSTENLKSLHEDVAAWIFLREKSLRPELEARMR